MRVTTDNGRRVEVKDGGRGIPLLLLHGFPLSSEIFAVMRPLVERVGRVIALDLPGFGSSDAPEAGYTMDDLAGEAMRVADRLGLERFALGGHSMGGYVALRVAAHHRDRLTGLVLIDTRAAADSPEAAAKRHAAAAAIRGGGRETYLDSFMPLLIGPTTSSRNPDLPARLRSLADAVQDHVLAGCLEGMAARPDSRGLLSGLELPALVVVGAEDELTPVTEARELSEALPRGRLQVIAEAGHTSPLECPEVFGEAVAVFLRELD